jgi:hypothetical protein
MLHNRARRQGFLEKNDAREAGRETEESPRERERDGKARARGKCAWKRAVEKQVMNQARNTKLRILIRRGWVWNPRLLFSLNVFNLGDLFCKSQLFS